MAGFCGLGDGNTPGQVRGYGASLARAASHRRPFLTPVRTKQVRLGTKIAPSSPALNPADSTVILTPDSLPVGGLLYVARLRVQGHGLRVISSVLRSVLASSRQGRLRADPGRVAASVSSRRWEPSTLLA